jgi:hypothetical protein
MEKNWLGEKDSNPHKPSESKRVLVPYSTWLFKFFNAGNKIGTSSIGLAK